MWPARRGLLETGCGGRVDRSGSALPMFLRSVCWAYLCREAVGINTRFELGGKPVATDAVSWSGGRMAFIVDTYLAPLAAPNALVTSVRCVLRSGNRVMVMENAEGRRHVLPGGRIEPGESFFGALRREIREETEYALAGAELLGACVFTHTTPRPDNYQYPYPTMIHLI